MRVFFKRSINVVSEQSPGLTCLSGLASRIGFVPASKRSDLDNFSTRADVDNLKALANNSGVAEALFYLLWCGIRGDVKIFGPIAEQEIANGSAHHIGLIAVCLQSLDDLQCAWRKILAGETCLLQCLSQNWATRCVSRKAVLSRANMGSN